MKKVLAAVFVLAGALVGYNWITTGELSLVPHRGSEESRELAALEQRVDALRRELGQAQRAAGLGGTDTTGDIGAATAELGRLAEDLSDLRGRLSDEADQRRGEQLAATIRELRDKLR